MTVQLKSHIELRGDNPYSAVIEGTNLQAGLVAQFMLGFSVEEGIQHYGITPAQAHAAMAFYYDNEDAIKAFEESSRVEDAINAEEHLAEMRQRLKDKNK